MGKNNFILALKLICDQNAKNKYVEILRTRTKTIFITLKNIFLDQNNYLSFHAKQKRFSIEAPLDLKNNNC
jgi:hypothetical protein